MMTLREALDLVPDFRSSHDATLWGSWPWPPVPSHGKGVLGWKQQPGALRPPPPVPLRPAKRYPGSIWCRTLAALGQCWRR